MLLRGCWGSAKENRNADGLFSEAQEGSTHAPPSIILVSIGEHPCEKCRAQSTTVSSKVKKMAGRISRPLVQTHGAPLNVRTRLLFSALTSTRTSPSTRLLASVCHSSPVLVHCPRRCPRPSALITRPSLPPSSHSPGPLFYIRVGPHSRPRSPKHIRTLVGTYHHQPTVPSTTSTARARGLARNYATGPPRRKPMYQLARRNTPGAEALSLCWIKTKPTVAFHLV